VDPARERVLARLAEALVEAGCDGRLGVEAVDLDPGIGERARVVGADDGRDWYITARAFTATGYGVYLITDCTGGDIAATFSEIVEKNPVVITP
jgi:hypothetical protein